MEELKFNMILDGENYKLSYSKDGRQRKITIGNKKNFTVIAARKITSEVDELVQANLTLEELKKFRTIYTDAKKCG